MNSSQSRPATSQEKRKLRKLSLRLKHLSEEQIEAELIKSEYDSEFSAMVSMLRAELSMNPLPDEDSDDKPSDVSPNFEEQFKNTGERPPLTEEEKEKIHSKVDADVRTEVENTASTAPSWMKRVYKQIATETHPDKVSHRRDLSIFEQAQRVGLFSKARTALVAQDGPTLLHIAGELGIDADVDVTMKIDMISSKITSIQEDVRKIYRSPGWIWGESYNNPAVRTKLLEGYCKIYNFNIPDPGFLNKFVNALGEGEG